MIRTFPALILLILSFVWASCGSNTRATRPQNIDTNPENPSNNMKSIYDFTLKSLDGSQDISLSEYKGKKMLLVNVASKCGYTPQYDDLQKLHEKYGKKLVILGFPANNFGGQEPGTHEEIAEFCKLNYGVTFQMFEKISVKGKNKHPLYEWLSNKEANGWNSATPSWNFNKYLIDEEGKLIKFFGSSVKPFDDELIQAIES